MYNSLWLNSKVTELKIFFFQGILEKAIEVILFVLKSIKNHTVSLSLDGQ